MRCVNLLRRMAGASIAAGLVVALATGTANAAEEFAPVDRPGPKLTVPADHLAASLTCTGNVAKASRAPVLLLGGTNTNTEVNFSWNWKPALTKAGIPWCASDIPDGGGPGNRNVGDEQTRAEYITHAIRTMYKLAGRKISIVGHSQGGSIMRWSLRFWPDTRRMVDDVIGIAPDNHGADVANAICAVPCKPAFWQIRPQSRFKAALNSYQETFAGISYTTIRSDSDELVIPHESSELSGPGMIANLRVQDRCPAAVSDHVTVATTDPVTEAYVMDALDNFGPTVVSRVNPAVCTQPFMSGVNPLTVGTDLADFFAAVAASSAAPGDPTPAAEPALRCYTLAAGCN